MIIAWLTARVGEKWARPIFYAGIVLTIFVAGMIVATCSHRDKNASIQAQQTTRSGDAIANAAQDAIGTITNRSTTEANLQDAAAKAQRNIDNANDPDDIRATVIGSVCRQASHRNDPSCRVQ